MGLFDKIKENISNNKITQKLCSFLLDFDKKKKADYAVVSDVELNQISEEEFEISKFIGHSVENMEIPSELNGKRIVGIADNAFCCLEKLENLKIREGIRFIGDRAFNQCYSLVSVELPETLEKVGEFCFLETSLFKINLPKSLKEIGLGAFSLRKL